MVYSAFLVLAITRLIPLSMGHDSSRSLALFEDFETTWSVGLIVFGLHLFGLGLLGVKSGFTPNLIGALLILAGLSYLMGESAELAAYEFPSTVSLVLAIFMIAGELVFAIWIMGARLPPCGQKPPFVLRGNLRNNEKRKMCAARDRHAASGLRWQDHSSHN